MGTRGVIARVHYDGWEGRYHHWDSNPRHLGKTLWDAWHEVFGGDTRAMLKLLVDEHPVGWSTINGADLTQPAGYREYGQIRAGEPDWRDYAAHEAWARTQGPQCYCHGDRHETEGWLIKATDDPQDLEWAYALSEDTPTMTVYECQWTAEHAGTWRLVAVVNLAGDEPDWKAM